MAGFLIYGKTKRQSSFRHHTRTRLIKYNTRGIGIRLTVCASEFSSSVSTDLELIKAQSEVEDLSELFGQRLLPLQVLSGREGRTRQGLQQTLQSLLCTHKHTQS